MKVLITGTTGYMGKILLNCLCSHEIVRLNRNSGEYQCDLSNTIPRFSEDFDLVIHASGKAHEIPKSSADSQAFFSVNVNGTANLLKGLEYKVPKRFVFISSVAVYGEVLGFGINENSFLRAKDPYGLSKILAEQLVLDWCRKNKVTCTILRLPLLVGDNPPGNLGAIIKAIKKGYYFNIDDGKAMKSMVLVEDVAKFIPVISPIGGIYNLTDGIHPSFYQLSLAIGKKKIYNMPLFLARILAKFGDLLGCNFPLNSTKLNKLISDLTFDDLKARDMGWKPRPVLEYLQNLED